MPCSAPSLVSLALSSHRGGPARSSDRATLLYVPFPRLPPPLPIVLTARVCFLRYHRTLPAATPFTISVFCWAWSIKRKVSPRKERGLWPADQGRNGHATAHRRGGVALRASSFISGPRLSYLIHTCTVDVLRRLHSSPFPERAWLLVAFQLPRMPFTRSFLPLSLGSRGHLLSADMLLPFVVICPNQMGPISGPSHLGCSLQMGPHYWPPPPATHYPSLFLYLPL